MPHFQIRSKTDEGYVVRLASCSQEHADSVRGTLLEIPDVPTDLEAVVVDHLYDDQPYGFRRRVRNFFRRKR